MKMKKQCFGEQMLAGPCRDNGTQRGILTSRLCQAPPCLQRWFILQSSMVTAPFLEEVPLSTFFQAVRGGGQNSFLSLLGLDCLQLKLTHMPETFWGGKFCSPTGDSPWSSLPSLSFPVASKVCAFLSNLQKLSYRKWKTLKKWQDKVCKIALYEKSGQRSSFHHYVLSKNKVQMLKSGLLKLKTYQTISKQLIPCFRAESTRCSYMNYWCDRHIGYTWGPLKPVTFYPMWRDTGSKLKRANVLLNAYYVPHIYTHYLV